MTGKNYDERRDWIQDSLQWLASGFQIDILGYGLMGNHFHCLLRNRPDLARQLSNLEVVLCWWRVSAASRAKDGSMRKMSRRRLERLLTNQDTIREYRRRLSSISWFMSRLKQPVARRANRQDGVTGRFWEGRFESECIESSEQLLAAMVYIDLNPIRAGLAETPEESLYTGVYQRIKAWRYRQKLEAPAAQRSAPATEQLERQLAAQKMHQQIDAWLSPLEFDESSEQILDVAASSRPDSAVDLEAAVAQAAAWSPRPRASDRGCVPLSWEKYFMLVDWTGRQVREDKTGHIPSELPPLLERLGFSGPDSWLATLKEYATACLRKISGPANQTTELECCTVTGTTNAASFAEAFL